LGKSLEGDGMKKKFQGTHEEYLELQKSYIGKVVGRDGKPCEDKVTHARKRAPGDFVLFKSRFWRYRKFINLEEKAVLLGARLGTETLALRSLGHKNCIGMDVQTEYAKDETLVEYGDFMNLKYDDSALQFAYTNCIDHLLDPQDFIEGLERVMKKNSFALFDIDTQHKSNKGFQGWDIFEPNSYKELLEVFRGESRHFVSHEEAHEPFGGGCYTLLIKFGDPPTKDELSMATTARSCAQEAQIFETDNEVRRQYINFIKPMVEFQHATLLD
jgi:hypothetical protein